MIVLHPILTPTVELAFERFDAEWPCVWLVYGDAGVGWKDPHLSHVYVKVEGYRFLVGDDRFREVHVRAVKRETAIDRAVELLRSTVPLEVTIYHVQLPPTAAEVGFLEAFNAKLQRDPRWGAFANSGRSRAVGTAPRARGDRRHLPSQRRRSLSIGMR